MYRIHTVRTASGEDNINLTDLTNEFAKRKKKKIQETFDGLQQDSFSAKQQQVEKVYSNSPCACA